MKQYLLSVILSICYFNIFSQPIILSDKVIGGPGREISISHVFNSDTLLLVGDSNSLIGFDKTDSSCIDSSLTFFDMWMVSMDDTFNIFLDKSIGGANEEKNVQIYSYQEKLFMLCTSKSNISCEKSANSYGYPNLNEDVWLYATNLDYTYLFDKTYGGTGAERSSKMTFFDSGNMLIMSLSDSPISGDKSENAFGFSFDYWIIKLDSLGNKIWDKTIGGYDLEFGNGEFDLLSLSNSENIIIAGSTRSPVGGTLTSNPLGSSDIFINEIDSSGNILWEQRYGGTDNDRVRDIFRTTDNGFVLTGFTFSPQGNDVSEPNIGSADIWILKLDSAGNKLWDKRYGGLLIDNGIKIKESFTNGYYLLSVTSSDSGFAISQSPYGLNDYWFMELDSVGNKLWDARFGGPINSIPYDFHVFSDSSFLLFGISDSGINAIKTEFGKGDFDFWLVHFMYDNSTGIQEINTSERIAIFPNPSLGIIDVPDRLIGSEILIYDSTGRIIEKVNKLQAENLNLKHLECGFYVISFKKNGRHYIANWIKTD